MEKLKVLILGHTRWNILTEYIERIESHREVDFSLAFENSKAMLESIGKEICKERGCPLDNNSSINGVLKKTFPALGHLNSAMVQQISTALANIGQQMGDLRNEIGVTAHGPDLEALRERNNKVDLLTRDFLLDSTSTVAIFLIRAFEERQAEAVGVAPVTPEPAEYDDLQDFNDFWDDAYDEFVMGAYSYAASEILFSVDREAYQAEYQAYQRERLASDIYADEYVHLAKDDDASGGR